MDFLNFFGLKDNPFRLTPDPSYFYPSVNHNDGLMLLDYAMEQKEGFCLIIGDPGTGKTTLLNVFLERWRAKAEIAIIFTPRLSPEEFLVSVIEDLGISVRRKSKNEIIKAFRDFMIEKSAEDKRVIIIVDEAQNLPDKTLEELRLLSNIETDKEKLLQIILIGQPELESRLKTEQLKQINQRITTRIHLRRFTVEETMDYINHRLIKAGRQSLNIHKSVKMLLHKSSKGIPRLINMLFLRALMSAYLEETNTILLRHIHHAIKSLNHNEIRVQRNFLIPVSAGALSIALIVVAYMFLTQSKSFESYRSYKPNNTIQNTVLQNNDASLLPPLPSAGEKLQSKVEVPIISKDKIASSQNVGTPSPIPLPDASGEGVRGRVKNVFSEQNKVRQARNDLNQKQKEIAIEERRKPAFRILSIKSDAADLREVPSATSAPIGASPKGNQFVVLEESVDDQNIKWYQVFYEGEKRWVSGEAVDIIEIKTEQKSKSAEGQ